MPETSVDEDDGLMLGQDDIRTAGQISAMKPEAVAHPVQHTTDDHLRYGILSPHLTHYHTACGGVE